MPLPKGMSNLGVKNLIPFPKGKSGYSFPERVVNCVVCRKEFKTHGTNTKYCSEICINHEKTKKHGHIHICEFCGITFKRKAPNNLGRFCSRQCSGLWIIAHGKNNYFYQAFLYLDHSCNRCGDRSFDVLLVHHKDRDRKNNKLDNLEILCANCHYRIHFGNGKTRNRKIIPIINFLKKEKNRNVTSTTWIQ